MIPVPSLDDVCIRWYQFRREGYLLHGFLLYTVADHYFPEYIGEEGLTDLDIWSGDRCGIFLIHEPAPDWVEYTREKGHAWWKVFGAEASVPMSILEEVANVPVLEIGDGELRTPRQVFSRKANRGLAKKQIANVLEYFELEPTLHPSLVLFRDIQDSVVWVVSFDELLNLEPINLRQCLKEWFAGPEFRHLMTR